MNDDSPGKILDSSVDDVVRATTDRLAKRANEACLRLSDSSDREALHDFRVNVRRLETVLRAFNPKGSTTERLNESLKNLIRRSNKARDAEVMLDWLSVQNVDSSVRTEVGVDWLVARMRRRREKVSAKVYARIMRDWQIAEKRMKKLNKKPRYDTSHSFGEESGELIVRYCERLSDHVRSLDQQWSDKTFHKVRLEIKRLRYLLEPLEKHTTDIGDTIIELKKVQDAFGALRDSLTAIEIITEHVERAAGAHARRTINMILEQEGAGDGYVPEEDIPDPAIGLKELLSHAARRHKGLMDTIRNQYLNGSLGALISTVRGIGGDLQNQIARRRADQDGSVLHVA